MDEDRRINRRRFFREGLGELLRPLVQATEPLQEAIRQIGSLDADIDTGEKARTAKGQAAAIRRALGVWHRPPGALPEQAFGETCSRCGDCAQVCPAQCIKIDPDGVQGAGVPYIDIDTMPCVMCDGLLCMHNCPTGALLPTPIGEIDMGTAAWHPESCLRSRDQECTICIDQCPIGAMAIELREGDVNVIESGCTGCGVCQHYCPTIPKSITVTPRAVEGGGAVSRGRPGGAS